MHSIGDIESLKKKNSKMLPLRETVESTQDSFFFLIIFNLWLSLKTYYFNRNCTVQWH